MGISFILFVFFYFGFYLKAANAYAFTNKRVLIHQGWLSTHMISVDYSKITDVHIRESFFAKIITHTGNIAIITAGTTRDQIILGNVNEPYEIKKRLDALKDK
ncbi:MAG: PH domain-containing protein [bacterium]